MAQFSPERNRGATEEVRTAAAGPGTPSPREGHFGSLHLGTTDDLPVLTAAATRPLLAELLDEIECWQRLLLELHTEIVTAEALQEMGLLVGRAFHFRDEALRTRFLELGRCIAWRAREQTLAFRETGAAMH